MHVLIPHASCLAFAAPSLCPPLPHLEALLARLMAQPLQSPPAGSPRSLSTPHETLLARLLGLPPSDGRIPWAAWQRWRDSGQTDHTPWAKLSLCHWQVSTQQVQLLHPELLQLSPDEDQLLHASLAEFFAPDGLQLERGSQAGRWWACGEPLRDLPCASLDRLLEPDVDAHLLGRAGDAAAQAMRRLQNETQMLLYSHPVNQARAARGALPINAFVLSGAGVWQPAAHPPMLQHWHGAGQLQPPPAGAILQIDSLRQAALRADAQAWVAAWQALDQQLAAPAWQTASRQAGFSLTLCGSHASQSWQCQPSRWATLWSTLQPWRRPRAHRQWLQQL
jgi:hypothetical protein